jgi:hypothetical protein
MDARGPHTPQLTMSLQELYTAQGQPVRMVWVLTLRATVGAYRFIDPWQAPCAEAGG